MKSNQFSCESRGEAATSKTLLRHHRRRPRSNQTSSTPSIRTCTTNATTRGPRRPQFHQRAAIAALSTSRRLPASWDCNTSNTQGAAGLQSALSPAGMELNDRRRLSATWVTLLRSGVCGAREVRWKWKHLRYKSLQDNQPLQVHIPSQHYEVGGQTGITVVEIKTVQQPRGRLRAI